MAKYLGSQKVAMYLGRNLIDTSLFTGEATEVSLSINKTQIAATADGWGNVWIGGGSSSNVDWFDKDTFERRTYMLEPSHNHDCCACMDGNGLAWFIFCRGNSRQDDVNTFTPSGTKTVYGIICEGQGHGKACVTDDFGRVWSGGGNYGSFLIMDVFSSPSNRLSYLLSEQRAYPAAAKDGRGHLWFGNQRTVEVFDPMTGNSRIYTFSTMRGTGSSSSYPAATCDGLGNVWFLSGNSADIFTPDGERSTVQLSVSMATPCATMDGNGNVWVAHGNTVNIFELNRYRGGRPLKQPTKAKQTQI